MSGATHCTAGAQPESQSQAQPHSKSQPQLRADGPACSTSPDPFGSLPLLSSLPRLEHLSCNFAQPRAAGQEGEGGSHCGDGDGDGVLDQLRQLQGAFLSRGRPVYCEWRGQRVAPPPPPPPAPASAAADCGPQSRSAASSGEGEEEEEMGMHAHRYQSVPPAIVLSSIDIATVHCG